MSDTAIPHDFLRHLLDSDFQGLTHAVDFGFLDRVVYTASNNGSHGATAPAAVLTRPERLAVLQAAGKIASLQEMRSRTNNDDTGDSKECSPVTRRGSPPWRRSSPTTTRAARCPVRRNRGKHGPDSPKLMEIDAAARTAAALRLARPGHQPWQPRDAGEAAHHDRTTAPTLVGA